MMLAPISPTPQPRPLVLSEARDHLRPLLIFAPTSDDARMQTQCNLLSAPALVERDVIVAVLPLQSAGRSCQALAPASISDAEANDARHRFHIEPNSFTVILIGKDGGEKLRSIEPIQAQKLLDTIDAMPMRRQEMARRPTEPKTP